MSDQTLKAAFIAQDRVRLFIERNHFKTLAERYERQLADENHPTLKTEVVKLQQQLNDQRLHSIYVVGVLLVIIVLLLGGYLLCPDYMQQMNPILLNGNN